MPRPAYVEDALVPQSMSLQLAVEMQETCSQKQNGNIDAGSILDNNAADTRKSIEQTMQMNPGPSTAFEEFIITEIAKLQNSILNEWRFSISQPTTENCTGSNEDATSFAAKRVETFNTLPEEEFQVVREATTERDSRKQSRFRQKQASRLFKQSFREIVGEKKISVFSNDDDFFHGLRVYVESPAFDCVVAVVVFVNCMFICGEAQVEGFETGNNLFDYSTIRFSDSWTLFFRVVDIIFIVFYIAEILFKIAILRMGFFKSRWNVFDAVTIVISAVSAVLYFVGISGLPINPTFVRLARLAKLARLFQILRSMTFFDSFLILIKSLKASVGALFWSLFFLFVVIASSAFIVNQIIMEHLRHKSRDLVDEDAKHLFLRFGTFTRAMMTFVEMTLGNFGPPTWTLIDHVHEFLGLFMVGYKCTAGFAMLNVINAVFLRLTMKQADVLDGHAIEQAKLEVVKYRQKVSNLFDIMDTSGDGMLSHEEFALLCESNSLRAWMKLVHVSTHDIDGLWRALANNNGHIEKEEFLESFSKLSGNATAIDSVMIKATLRDIQQQLDGLIQRNYSATTVGRLGSAGSMLMTRLSSRELASVRARMTGTSTGWRYTTTA